MTPLRTRMIEDMKLAGLAAKTQEVYLQAVSALAKHYKRSPELLTEEEVRRYLLDARERRSARATRRRDGETRRKPRCLEKSHRPTYGDHAIL